MSKNEGDIDRIVRVLVGLAVLTQVFWGLQTPWAYVGLILVGTGIVGYCPLYPLFGISTCAAKNQSRQTK